MRLTKKRENNYPSAYEWQEHLANEPLNKLGQLEDIEEELGIDLITLFKAIQFPIYIKELGTSIWQSNRIMSVFGQYYILCVGDSIILKTKDYGKTWALTEEEVL